MNQNEQTHKWYELIKQRKAWIRQGRCGFDGENFIGNHDNRICRRYHHPYTTGLPGIADGFIIYDKENSYDGWRYLEVAPKDTEIELSWANFINVRDTLFTEANMWMIENLIDDPDDPRLLPDLGSGRNNTLIIIDLLKQTNQTGCAAQYCYKLNIK